MSFKIVRVFQKINDPKPVIASETKCSNLKVFAIASLRFAPLAMTIGHFFTWSTLTEYQTML
jgi:hypothetical protein